MAWSLSGGRFNPESRQRHKRGRGTEHKKAPPMRARPRTFIEELCSYSKSDDWSPAISCQVFVLSGHSIVAE
jgi:hypothetical protein